MSAAVVWGALLTMMTELLGLFKLLTFSWLLGLWGVATLAAAVGCYVLAKRTGVHFRIPRIPRFELLLLGGVGLIVAVVGLIALIAPPNTWDALVYHMSRVMHWVQNRSLAHYPTPIMIQLHQSPGAEFILLHLQMLSGGDRLANLVQWFSMVASLVGVSFIARQLGADRLGQILAAVVSATIPMGILQGSSTQTDYVLAFWLVCFVSYLLLLRKQPGWVHSFAAGISLGLAILTKATAYVFALPFLVWFGLSMLKSLRWKLWQPALAIALTVLVLNLGHYARNYDLYGHPLGPGQESSVEQEPAPIALLPGEAGGSRRYANDVFTLSSLISNVLRNVALHMGTPIEPANEAIERGILFLHTLLGLEVNDPRTTWTEMTFQVTRPVFHEAFDGNPVHLALIVWTLVIFLASREQRSSPDPGIYAVVLTLSFLLFCFYLKWQPWHSRLHLPLFVLWSAFSAVVLSRMSRRRLAGLLALVLILSALPWVLYNNIRPLVGQRSIFSTSRIDQYFNNYSELRDPYVGAAEYVKAQGCTRVGLHIGRLDWEYPLWVFLQDGQSDVRIEHVNVENPSKRSAQSLSAGAPCAVISSRDGQALNMIVAGNTYVRAWSSGRFGVFIRP